jgi:hypothetical protein
MRAPPVGRVWQPFHVTTWLQIVDKLGHRLARHLRARGEFGDRATFAHELEDFAVGGA